MSRIHYRDPQKRLLRSVRNPPPVYKIREIEKEFAARDAAEEQHGPVRVIMQGGKKCNVIIVIAAGA